MGSDADREVRDIARDTYYALRDKITKVNSLWMAYRAVVESMPSIVTIALLVGSTLGVIAGFTGGWLDNVIMRIMDVILGFPSLLLAIAIDVFPDLVAEPGHILNMDFGVPRHHEHPLVAPQVARP